MGTLKLMPKYKNLAHCFINEGALRKKKHTLKLHRLFLKPELIKHSFTPQIQVLNKSPSKFAYKYKNKDITPKNSYLRRPKNWRFFHFKCPNVLEFSPFAIDMLLLHIQTILGMNLTHIKKNILLLHFLITTHEKRKYVSDHTRPQTGWSQCSSGTSS